LLSDSRLWSFLLQVDGDLAGKTREGGCPFCRAPLHKADYPRKPRGAGDDLPDGYGRRFSFSCSSDGCRRRATPPSVRFLGPKVYLKTLVILLTAMRQGPSPQGFNELRRLFDVSRRTLVRWQVWWKETFPRLAFWRSERARFVPPLDERAMPSPLVTAFAADSSVERLLLLLRFLSPITTRRRVRIHDL
jgi:hypothetical protein